MAADIERLSKMIAPVLQGHLYAGVRHYQLRPLHWRVDYGSDSLSSKYALYQEMGERRDGSHTVMNYTKPGTGAHFLEIAGSNVAANAPGAFRGASAAIGHGIL
jgi:hypothetical protein